MSGPGQCLETCNRQSALWGHRTTTPHYQQISYQVSPDMCELWRVTSSGIVISDNTTDRGWRPTARLSPRTPTLSVNCHVRHRTPTTATARRANTTWACPASRRTSWPLPPPGCRTGKTPLSVLSSPQSVIWSLIERSVHITIHITCWSVEGRDRFILTKCSQSSQWSSILNR